MSVSILELAGYATMTALVVKAVAHRLEAWSLGRQAKKSADTFWYSRVRPGASEYDEPYPVWTARFRRKVRTLLDKAQFNRNGAPEWGLFWSVLGIVVALSAAAGTTGAEFRAAVGSGAALALINTGLGMLIARIEGRTIAILEQLGVANVVLMPGHAPMVDATREESSNVHADL